MHNPHLLAQTFSQARNASGTHQFNGLGPPLTIVSYNPIIEIDLGGTSDREVIFDQHALECKGDSLLLYGGGGPHTDIISTEGQVGYMSWDRPSIVWLDAHWAVRFEMDPSVEIEECSGYCFRYVFVSEGKLVERYKSEK